MLDKVKTRTGVFVGKEKDGVAVFKGIPYAKPPVGALRWHDPQPLEDSDEVFEVYEFGKTTIQEISYDEQASQFTMGEDCLTLNIWTADTDPAEKKPVMVWIHGGAHVSGGTTDPVYDGHNMVSRHKDIVLVTINYRVGTLGFLDLTRFGKEYENSVNLGICDQIAALKWIQENIEAFGGDKDNVTIFGESAGGGSVGILMITEAAKGLFHKAIIQSAAIAYKNTRPKGFGEFITDNFMRDLGVETIEELLEVPESKLIEHAQEQYEFNMPVRDGRLIPEDPWELFEKGMVSANVPLMVGSNSEEEDYDLIMLASIRQGFNENIKETGNVLKVNDDDYAEYGKRLEAKFQTHKGYMTEEHEKIVDKYFDMLGDISRQEKLVNYFTERHHRIRTVKMAEDHSKYAPTYLYYWKIPSGLNHCGALHAIELAYVFNNPDAKTFTGEYINEQRALEAQDAWVNFARTGNPSTEEKCWPEYESNKKSTMVFDVDGNRIEEMFMWEHSRLLMPLHIKYPLFR